ncbi:MAG: hypothetical protein RR902_01500 [Oscillospiraceae bacterium]
MLKNVNEVLTLPSDKLDEKLIEAREKLMMQAQHLKENRLPVLVMVEGFGTAGKGSVISKIIRNIDPRFFDVYASGKPDESELRKPFLYRYFAKIPMAGKFAILDGGYIEETTGLLMQGSLNADDLDEHFAVINYSSINTENVKDGFSVLKTLI